MKGRGPGPNLPRLPSWGTTQESITPGKPPMCLRLAPCPPRTRTPSLSRRQIPPEDRGTPARQPQSSAEAAGSAGPTCVPRARPGYVHPSPARSRELRTHRVGGGAPRAVPPAPAGGGAAPHSSNAAPAGPARQVAAPPRGRRAERNAPAAPARGRAAVGVATRPHLAPTGWDAAGRARPGLPLAARPAYLHTGRARGAGRAPGVGRSGAGRGRQGPTAAAEFGLRAGDGPAPRLQVTREGSQTGGRGLWPGWGGGARTHKLEGKEGSRVGDGPSAHPVVPPGAGQPLPTAHCAAPDPLCV